MTTPKYSDPFDRVMPEGCWQDLKQQDRYAQYRAQHPLRPPPPPRGPSPQKETLNPWGMALAGAILIAFFGSVINHQLSAPKPSAVRFAAATPEPTPTPMAIAAPPSTPLRITPRAQRLIVPRAEPVEGPLSANGQPMKSGNQYYVTMPDGRYLLVNYMGWVDHAVNLPRQLKGGANNAMYTDRATGLNWIWTVPLDSNTPKWIDP